MQLRHAPSSQHQKGHLSVLLPTMGVAEIDDAEAAATARIIAKVKRIVYDTFLHTLFLLVNFAGFTLERDVVDLAYKADTEIPRASFKGKTNDEWVSEFTAQQFVEPFKDLEEDAQHRLECVKKGTLWAVHTVKTLPSTNFRRVAIMGADAHDAYLLMTVLETVPRALAIYDKSRRPFSSEVALRSMRGGQLCAFQEDVPLHELGDAITKNWEWAWLTDLDDALKEAVRLVEDSPIDVN
ncbi:uncharacterized protein F5147DRAFT_770510 [Suillus discolor]|uniref:Uncharacterized protein n=1 Tax=Suillus discolor TaxID=1912936 RepID=A0A9P7JX84_9AGAM|nr:uncharacterized protein F5147DRAFT_770510 [Suillus discolor]KAG2113863.1 hypothetical protein F5147DRAFT_770510 [Suillus discolor]